jgi:hypothetical protein
VEQFFFISLRSYYPVFSELPVGYFDKPLSIATLLPLALPLDSTEGMQAGMRVLFLTCTMNAKYAVKEIFQKILP